MTIENSEVIHSWKSSGSVFLDEVGFLKPGKALYLYSTPPGAMSEYMEGEAPVGQAGIAAVISDDLLEGRILYAILMSPQDIKAYRDECVAKETIKLG